MIYIIQNIWAISAATVASFAFGALWYTVLSKPWMKASGITEEMIRGESGKVSPAPYVVAFLAEFWIASILAGALILAPVEAGKWTIALMTAFILWVGFIAPAMLVNNRYELRPLSLFGINAAHWLLVLIIQAMVIRLVGVVPPT